MSRKSNREDRVLENLQNQNREQKQEIRRLQKLVKKLDRGFKRTIEHTTDEESELPVTVQKLCFDCGGNYKEVIIHNRRFRQCDNCAKRGKVTILNV